jgi:hypothetical protein
LIENQLFDPGEILPDLLTLHALLDLRPGLTRLRQGIGWRRLSACNNEENQAGEMLDLASLRRITRYSVESECPKTLRAWQPVCGTHRHEPQKAADGGVLPARGFDARHTAAKLRSPCRSWEGAQENRIVGAGVWWNRAVTGVASATRVRPDSASERGNVVIR